MGKGSRMKTEINASSMADIAFLLLVFFLVTTTMDSDWGLTRKLPPPPENLDEKVDFHKRNILVVLANANDQLLVGNDLLDVTELKEKAKEFIVNAAKKENLPEVESISVGIAKAKIADLKSKNGKPESIKKWEKRLKAAEVLGKYNITKQVISLQNDRGTSYDLYIKVQNELAAAYRELRDELAMTKFSKKYSEIAELAEKDKEMKARMDAIKTVYPQRISEAEPKDVAQ